MAIALLLHLLAVIVWVGGMFFALFVLRGAAARTLDPPLRLPLLADTLDHFFRWVAGSIAVLLLTGGYMIYALGGFRAVGVHVHAMVGLGIVMILVFGHLRFVSYRRLQHAVAAKQWPTAGTAMGRVRKLVMLNFVLGVLTIAVVILGRGL